jgi:hypothetical protein
MLFPLASQESQFHASIVVLVVGLLIGVFGHIYKSRTMILMGIVVVGLFSVLFAFGSGHLT